MDTLALEYGFLGLIVVMIFFAFLIGTHKMLQVIIATTCISLVTLGWSGFLTFFAQYITSQTQRTIFGYGPEAIGSFLQSAQMSTGIIVFVLLLIYAIHYSSSSVVLSAKVTSSKLLQLLLSPLAIFCMIVSFAVALLGIDVFSLSFLISIQTKFGQNSLITLYIRYLPLGILVQGVIALLLIFQKERKVEISYDDI